MLVALVLFALAAGGGITLATLRARGKPLPMPLTAGHGLLAAGGLIALIVHAATASASGVGLTALAMFLIAALGGLALLASHVRGQHLPMGLVVGHGMIAALGIVLLLVAYLGG